MTLTFEQRQELKQKVSDCLRAQLPKKGYCVNCGCEWDEYTEGCETCRGRKGSRKAAA